MSSEIASQARFFINYSGGNFQLLRLVSLDPKDERKTEVVTAVGVKDGAGFRRKPGGRTLTGEGYVQAGTPEVDWQRLADTQEEFALTIVPENSERRIYRPVRVSSVDRKHNDKGEHMETIEFVCLGSTTTG